MNGQKKRLLKPPKGMKRQWVKCKQCGDIAYYDYIPFGLSTPIMTLPCHHGIAIDFNKAVTYITEKQAIYWLRGK